MTAANQYLPFATGTGANTLTYSAYAALSVLAQGFQNGIADPAQFNTLMRQLSTAASGLAQFIADNQASDVLDDGVPANFEAKFKAALSSYLGSGLVHYGVATGTGDAMVVAATPTMTASGSGGYQPGSLLIVKTPSAANTSSAPTVNANTVGNIAITRRSGGTLAAGDIPATTWIGLFFDGVGCELFGFAPSDVAAYINSGNPSLSPPKNIIAYQSAGTFSWTAPANVTEIDYEVVGGGGGGAGGGGSSQTHAGGGGGSGGTTKGRMAVTPGQVFSIVVGSGGAGAAGTDPSTGGTGGTSSLTGSIYATGATGGLTGSSSCAGGAPGQGFGGQVNLFGGNGGDGNPYSSQGPGGGGAASSLGGGGRTSTHNPVTVGGVNEVDGIAPGSGGGGIWYNLSTTYNGGNGAPGSVTIRY